MARSAFMTGWTHSPFGKLEDPDTEGLIARVLRPALDHAQIAAEDVDGIFVGIMNNGFQKQDFQGAIPGLIDPRCRTSLRCGWRMPARRVRQPSMLPSISLKQGRGKWPLSSVRRR